MTAMNFAVCGEGAAVVRVKIEYRLNLSFRVFVNELATNRT
jgi:hypothetical protein